MEQIYFKLWNWEAPDQWDSYLMRMLFGLLAGLVVLAETTTGTLTGLVVDHEGDGIPNATVTVINAVTAATNSALTNVHGEYQLSLPSGDYSVVVLKIGFGEQRVSGVKVRPNSAAATNVVLDTGARPVTVSVTNETIMTRALPDISREAITSLPDLALENATPSLRLDLSSIDVVTLSQRLELNPMQASRIRGILQERQARLLSIDHEANLTAPEREQRITTVSNQTNAAIRKVLSRNQRREYAVVRREFSIQ